MQSNLYCFYPKRLKSSLRFGSESVSANTIVVDATDFGIFPFAGPHQILEDDAWIKNHVSQVYLDSRNLIKDPSFDGILLVDYSRYWHPSFDFSSYSKINGYFFDKDFDKESCVSSLFNPKDDNYREDFYNWHFCRESSDIRDIDFDSDNSPLEPIMRFKWNELSSQFYTETVKAIKKFAPKCKVGFLDLPRAIYANREIVNAATGSLGYGDIHDFVGLNSANMAQFANSSLKSIWDAVDVLAPFIRSRRLTVSSSVTPAVGCENDEISNSKYIESNIKEAKRFADRFGKQVMPVFEHFYSAPSPHTRKALNETNWKHQLTIPFALGVRSIGLFYDQPEDPANQIQSDHLGVIARYLPSPQSSFNSGGTTSLPSGGLRVTGRDTQRISAREPSDPLFSKDTRPVRFYSLWEDSFSTISGADNKFASWWAEFWAISNFISRLNQDYDKGFRRFLLYMPAGNQTDNLGILSPNQWLTLPESFRNEFYLTLESWLSDKDIEIIIFAGGKTDGDRDALNSHQIDYSSVSVYNFEDDDDRFCFDRNFNPWFNIGVSALAFGNVNDFDDRQALQDFLVELRRRNIKTYSLGLPKSSPSEIDLFMLSLSPRLITFDQFRSDGSVADLDLQQFDVSVLITPQMSFAKEDIRQLIEKGVTLLVGEGTFIEDMLFEDPELYGEDGPKFVQTHGPGSDLIEGFGIDRYNPVNAVIDDGLEDNIYVNYDLVAVANSYPGLVVFNKSLTKQRRASISITNAFFRNTSLPHSVLEDQFDWLNSGLPSHLAQVRDAAIAQMGINMTRTNPYEMALVPSRQAKYLIPCNAGMYDVFNSTIDYKEESSNGFQGFTLPYVSAAAHIQERQQIWAGGSGGIVSISTEDYSINEINIEQNKSDLEIKDIVQVENFVYILERKALYRYDLNTSAIQKNVGVGWPENVFNVRVFPDGTISVSGTDGIYSKRVFDLTYAKVISSTSPITTMIAPDAGFAASSENIYYTTDGYNWQLMGANPLGNITKLVKLLNGIFAITDKNPPIAYSDNGSLYAQSPDFEQVELFDEVDVPFSEYINDVVRSGSQLLFGSSNGKYAIYNSFGVTVSDSGLDNIQRIVVVNGEPWFFAYNTFTKLNSSVVRKIVSGQSL